MYIFDFEGSLSRSPPSFILYAPNCCFLHECFSIHRMQFSHLQSFRMSTSSFGGSSGGGGYRVSYGNSVGYTHVVYVPYVNNMVSHCRY